MCAQYRVEIIWRPVALIARWPISPNLSGAARVSHAGVVLARLAPRAVTSPRLRRGAMRCRITCPARLTSEPMRARFRASPQYDYTEVYPLPSRPAGPSPSRRFFPEQPYRERRILQFRCREAMPPDLLRLCEIGEGGVRMGGGGQGALLTFPRLVGGRRYFSDSYRIGWPYRPYARNVNWGGD